MVTLIKQERSERTYSLVPEEEIIKYLRQETYRVILDDVRRIATIEASEGNTISPQNYCFRHLPLIRFSGQWKKQNGQVVLKSTNPLVLLEINNLASIEEAEDLRKRAAKIPYTYITFVGATGRSVEIVCRFAMKDDGDVTPKALENAYKQFHYMYTTQLNINVETSKPSFDQECYLSMDSQAFFNEYSMLLFVDEEAQKLPAPKVDDSKYMDENQILGLSSYQTNVVIYEHCLKNAYENVGLHPEDEEFDEKVLTLLADNCFRSGLPMEFALRHAFFKPAFYRLGEQIVNLKFENAYAQKLLRTLPFGKIPKSALLTYKTAFFLKEHYEFRRNAMTGAVQYRIRNGYCFDFVDLTPQAQNSMTIRALKAGLDSWDKDLKRFIDSNDIALYEPLDDYLDSLPKWDGKDRVTELTKRIPTSHPMWQNLFHIWMLSMVAHWEGKDSIHGNALVPLIIGHQGCGKSSFSRLILPNELRAYYNENINFRNDNDINLALSTLALVNMDEFDKLTKSQQPLLKFLVSRSDFQMRPAYGKTLERRRRYASFIGSTNAKRPLTDTTGSRRFLCVEVNEGATIDYQTPIDYDQLYAQLKEELNDGMRYWLTDEENERLSHYNERFLHVNDLQTMILSLFEHPQNENEAEELSLEEIMNQILQHFPYYTRTDNRNQKLGLMMKRELGFASKRTSKGMVYLVKRRSFGNPEIKH